MGFNREEYQQRKHDYMQNQKQHKHLIEIDNDTLLLFKNTSALMGDNAGTFSDILRKVLDHWNQCTEVEIDRY